MRLIKIICLVGVAYLAGCVSGLIRQDQPRFKIGQHVFRHDGVEVYVEVIEIHPYQGPEGTVRIIYKVDNGAAHVWMEEDELTPWK